MILDVVKARLDEIFDMLSKQLIVPGFNLSSWINLLLTGVNSDLNNIEKSFSDFFRSNVKLEEINNKNQEKDLEKNFASCFGAIKIIKDGWETEAIPEVSYKYIKKIGFFAKICVRFCVLNSYFYIKFILFLIQNITVQNKFS